MAAAEIEEEKRAPLLSSGNCVRVEIVSRGQYSRTASVYLFGPSFLPSSIPPCFPVRTFIVVSSVCLSWQPPSRLDGYLPSRGSWSEGSWTHGRTSKTSSCLVCFLLPFSTLNCGNFFLHVLMRQLSRGYWIFERSKFTCMIPPGT